MTTFSKFNYFKSIFRSNVVRCFHSRSLDRSNSNAKYLLQNVPKKCNFSPVRNKYTEQQIHEAKTWCYYFIALTIAITGAGFAAVPVFSAYCQVYNVNILNVLRVRLM